MLFCLVGEFSKKLKIDSSVTDSENDEPLRRVTNKYSRILEAKNNSSESSNNEESPSFCVINDSSNKTEGLLENSVSSQQEKFLSASQSPEKSNEKENDIDKVLTDSSLREKIKNCQMTHQNYSQVRRESLKRKLYYRSDVMSKGEEDTPSSSKKKVVSADILEAVRQSVRDAMRSVVKSIQIDLRKSTDEVKNLIISKNMALVHGPNVTITREKLNVVVPIKSLDEFLQYEDLLQKNKEERNTLVKLKNFLLFQILCVNQKKLNLYFFQLSFFRILIYSLTTEKDCVAAILPAMLTKNVQLEYSGVGRAIHGEAKRNFSATQMCTILKDATIEKLGSAGNLKTLQTIISRWLSGAGDRDGGRKNR
ncbi:PREDICTED: uncharacterized protein LOC105556670 [Vollenhovia emeryi]|uniref:uncharacterized protein LOC105556670 n=1 Tax=Vollenhovia emeryi TaxID=411798 RepID=UPI0005F52356|nr:PREDICTED: uncharacterized protein LOC105556670 [Vollenhovia emeryi]